jgi:hypothetical protein
VDPSNGLKRDPLGGGVREYENPDVISIIVLWTVVGKEYLLSLCVGKVSGINDI